MKKSRFVMMLLTLFVSIASYAQSISGTVTDDQGEPVIGASVVEKGKPQNGRRVNPKTEPSPTLMVSSLLK